ncbi:MAG: ATP-dependent helicase [Bacteroidota bacterium]
MVQQALAPLLYRELHKILSTANMSTAEQIVACRQLLDLIFLEATRREKLPFTTHFARIAYAAHQYNLPKSLLYYVHHFRRLGRNAKTATESSTLEVGTKAIADVIFAIWQQPPAEELATILPLQWPMPVQEFVVAAFRTLVRVVALEDDATAQQLIGRDTEHPAEAVRIQYHLADRNELFTPTIDLARKVTGFPVQLNLLDVEVGADGIYRPRAVVLEPDFLIDVSAVAESFQGGDTHPWGYLLKKYLPFQQSIPLMLGNIANYFLDELMSDPEVTFQELVAGIFGLNPLAFCLFTDGQIRELMGKAQGHFVRLKQMVQVGFKEEDLDRRYCYLEPTFYSEMYGLQGRLDVLYRNPQPEGRSAIVELKSGKPYRPNIHGISPNHYIQTVLYDFLVRSAYGQKSNVGCYILYSSQEQRPLRFAPAVKAQQYEALQVRNHLLAIEHLLSQLGVEDEELLPQTQRLFLRLQAARYPHLKGFSARDLDAFASVFQQLSPLEKRYFGAFSGFIAREHLLAKTGVQGMDRMNGLASLWLDHPQEKEENYQRLAQLQLAVNNSKEIEPILILLRGKHTNPLANFRVGDIAVLFPYTEDGKGVLQHQVFKCTIISLDLEQVTVRLRSRQFNDRLFVEQEYWTLEHDLLDSSINAYYRGLFEWAQRPSDRRQLLLGLRPPKEGIVQEHTWPSRLTDEQAGLLDRMLAAPEYFLLWGPPGTGKTSVMLHHLVRHLLEETDEHLLLLAYTNRAVDEMCESIEAIGEEVKSQYLRIGSNYGTHPRFQDRLLQNAIKGTRNRRELRQLIASKRIFVGTVAALANKTDLFALKKFQRVIIDEASQILEPLLMGLLGRFQQWILIGDHRQLPAVVAQSEELTEVRDEELRAAGITSLGQSLFERLYLKSQAKDWHWTYGQLTHQGRMHQDIVAFPAQQFYQGHLDCLPENTTYRSHQERPIHWELPPDANVLEQQLTRQRVVYLPTPVDEDSATLKTNQHEARLLVDIIKAFHRLAGENGEELAAGSMGIITPYRAQIAQIRALLTEEELAPEDYTIDTVERYQGGARDIILISLCTNSERQLQSLSSLSAEGVDRKLNVAMTRARSHLVVLGNEGILKRSPVYYELLSFCRSADAKA